MSIRFILGRSGSGKSSYIIKDILKKVQLDEKTPIIILVPEQFTFEFEKRISKLFMGRIKDKYLRTRVLSFNSLSSIVFSEVGGLGDVNINSCGKSIITYKSIEKVQSELGFFSKSINKVGFVSAINEIITEFKQYKLDHDVLLKMSEEIDDDMLRMKLKDIYKIYDEYDKNLHEKFIDSQDLMTSLYNKISNSRYLKDAYVYIDEFTGFTPTQYSIVTEIMKQTKEVNISLTYDYYENINTNGFGVFDTTKYTYEKLMKLSTDENLKVYKPIFLKEAQKFKNNAELIHLEKNYTAYPFKKYKEKTSNIKIREFKSLYQEIEEIAKEILMLVKEEDIRFKNITVATRSLDKYDFLIQSIFSEYSIPYFMDKKRASVNNPIIVLIISLLEMKNRGFTYETVFRYVKCGLLDTDLDNIGIIENYVIANGIKGNKWFMDRWEYGFASDVDSKFYERDLELIERINEVKNSIFSPINNFYKKLSKHNKVKELCTYLYEFLMEIDLESTLNRQINSLKKMGELDRANEYIQVWDIVMDTLDQMVELLGDENISLSNFIKTLTLGFEESELGLVPPSLDQVLVSSVDRMKNSDTEYLYLIGINEGLFPLIVKDDKLLNDNDRLILEKNGVELNINSIRKTYEEQFLIYRALTYSKKKLIISYPISDYEGNTLRPSYLIPKLKKIFTNIKIESYLIDENKDSDNYILKKLVSKQIAYNEMLSKIIDFINHENRDANKLNDLWIDIFSYFMNESIYKENLNKLLESLIYKPKESIAAREKIKKLYENSILSVSRLEKYSKCPFSYFIEYGLKAKERKEYEFNPPDMGILVHKVLELFSKNINKNSLTWRVIDDTYIEENVSKIIKDILEYSPNYILNSSPRYKYLGKRISEMVVNTIKIISHQIKSGSFEPVDYEVRFGENAKYSPIKLNISEYGEVNLIGQIDRVDELVKDESKYIRIVDYKTGANDVQLTDVYYGLQLQLLVYLDAIIDSYHNINVNPAGIMYLKIDNPIANFEENKDDKAIRDEILKDQRMNGLLIKDKNVLRNMDEKFLEDGKQISSVITVETKQDGSLKRSNSLVDYEEFEIIRNYVKKEVKIILDDMMSGNIDIVPFKKSDRTACDFCKYMTICKFDPSIKNNKYKIVTKKSNDEIIDRMKRGK